MSSYRKMVGHFWPWNSLRAAYLEWQSQESRLVKARQRLALEYQAACRQAEQVQIDTDQGILRTTRCRLDQPHDPLLLEVSNRLSRVFVLQGRGYFRRMPSLLEVELSQYTARVEEICQSHDELVGRLRLAQAVMTIFSRTPEFCGPKFFQLALISPESTWLLFHLRRKRRSGRQAMQDLLSKKGKLQE